MAGTYSLKRFLKKKKRLLVQRNTNTIIILYFIQEIKTKVTKYLSKGAI